MLKLFHYQLKSKDIGEFKLYPHIRFSLVLFKYRILPFNQRATQAFVRIFPETFNLPL